MVRRVYKTRCNSRKACIRTEKRSLSGFTTNETWLSSIIIMLLYYTLFANLRSQVGWVSDCWSAGIQVSSMILPRSESRCLITFWGCTDFKCLTKLLVVLLLLVTFWWHAVHTASLCLEIGLWLKSLYDNNIILGILRLTWHHLKKTTILVTVLVSGQLCCWLQGQ